MDERSRLVCSFQAAPGLRGLDWKNAMCISASQFNRGSLAVVQTEFANVLPVLHRIRTVRRQQGVNLKGLSRRTEENLYELAREELPGNDLMLSRLYRWQQWLNVPIAELLVEPDAGLSPRVLER